MIVLGAWFLWKLQCGNVELRILSQAMIKRVDPAEVKRTMDLIPGGDIRVKGNQWLRTAWRDAGRAGLGRVPREGQVREAVRRLVHKKKLRYYLSFVKVHWCNSFFIQGCFCWFFPGFGRDDEELELWIIEQVSSKNYVVHIIVGHNVNLIVIPNHEELINLSKALRCHQVIYQHQKQQRSGFTFISPDSKASNKSQILY